MWNSKKSLAELKDGVISMVAILNKHGAGELWFGVAPSGSVVGLDANEKTLRDVSQTIGSHIEPRIYPHIELAQLNGKSCLHITFSGQEMPYFAYGRTYMRVADEDRQLTARELENIILRKHMVARWKSVEIYCSVKLFASRRRAARRTVQSKQPAFAMKRRACSKLPQNRNHPKQQTTL